MLTDKDIGKRVICEWRRGRLETIRGELIKVDMGLAGPWIGGSAGWTLDEPAAEPANAAPDQRPGEDMPLAVRLRRWVEAHTPAGVTATALRALLSEAADEIDRLAEEQRKIMEHLDAVEDEAKAARAEWIDRDLGT